VARNSWLLFAGSTVIGFVLIAVLLGLSRVELASVAHLALGLQPVAFGFLVILIGINTYLAGEKWRLVERRLGGRLPGAMPRSLYFALTAMGVGLGVTMPVQVSAAISRSLGSHFYGGRALVRGTAATLFEQSFDLFAACSLAAGSAALLLVGGGALTWTALACVMGTAGAVATASGAAWAGHLIKRMSSSPRLADGGCAKRLLRAVSAGGLLSHGLAHRLFALSLLRFFVLTLMAGATTWAVGLDVPLWQLSAAMPFVLLAAAVPLTPGGLGMVEWAFASALVAYGTRFEIAAQWAVLNRLIVTIAAIAIGIAGVLVGIAIRSLRARSPAV
jgi:uncharacterized membrane protein YbhN (UPF0104 family)